MSSPDNPWGSKTNDELLQAAESLADFTEQGERALRDELDRRGVPQPPPTERLEPEASNGSPSENGGLGGGVVGLLLGALLGFLLRPANSLVGQLDLDTVLARGANLRGMNRMMVSLAETSFNYLIAGAIIGAAVGYLAARLVSNRSRNPTG